MNTGDFAVYFKSVPHKPSCCSKYSLELPGEPNVYSSTGENNSQQTHIYSSLSKKCPTISHNLTFKLTLGCNGQLCGGEKVRWVWTSLSSSFFICYTTICGTFCVFSCVQLSATPWTSSRGECVKEWCSPVTSRVGETLPPRWTTASAVSASGPKLCLFPISYRQSVFIIVTTTLAKLSF